MDQAVSENNLICDFCLKLLNVSPIYCIEHGPQVQRMCGRCVLDTNIEGTKLRQYVYEDLAKLMSYPCFNKRYGCKKILHWDEVETHENVCSFECVNCPLSYLNMSQKCSWSSHIKSFNEHIHSCHSEFILNPPQFNWTDLQKDTMFFVKVKGKLVTVYIKFNKNNKRYCLLMVNGSDTDSQCYRYQLDFVNEDDKVISLCKNRLESTGKILENMSNVKKMLEIDFSALKTLLNNSENISCHINIMKKPRDEIKQIKDEQDYAISTSSEVDTDKELRCSNENIFKELVCEACKQLIIPPIYITTTGYNICSDCKTENKPMFPCSGARNVVLETLTTKMQYPCRNKTLGCRFTEIPDKIRSHEEICEYSQYSCILGNPRCQWKGPKSDMYKHLIDLHKNVLMQVDTVYMHDTLDKKVSYNAMEVNGEFFRVSIKNINEDDSVSTQFSVQHLGTTQENPKFRFHLQIVDKSPLNMCMNFTNICQPLTKDRKKTHEMALTLPMSLCKALILDSKYCFYKIEINRI